MDKWKVMKQFGAEPGGPWSAGDLKERVFHVYGRFRLSIYSHPDFDSCAVVFEDCKCATFDGIYGPRKFENTKAAFKSLRIMLAGLMDPSIWKVRARLNGNDNNVTVYLTGEMHLIEISHSTSGSDIEFMSQQA